MSEDIQKTGEGSDEYYERGTLPHATKNIPHRMTSALKWKASTNGMVIFMF